jgi:glucose 1-dehydrogenase/3-oxoacyl-[acyl-carrier protein] reductase
MKLMGKIAVVTGASRGIGRGIAEVLAEEGSDVAVNYVSNRAEAERTARLVRDKGRRAIIVRGDVSKRTEVESVFERTWTELGPADILVNNAGIETIVPFLELTDEQWTTLVDIT